MLWSFLYALLLTRIGYVIASALLIAACMWTMGARRRRHLLWFPIVYSVVTWAIFGPLLNVRLPGGLLQAPLEALNLV